MKDVLDSMKFAELAPGYFVRFEGNEIQHELILEYVKKYGSFTGRFGFRNRDIQNISISTLAKMVDERYAAIFPINGPAAPRRQFAWSKEDRITTRFGRGSDASFFLEDANSQAFNPTIGALDRLFMNVLDLSSYYNFLTGNEPLFATDNVRDTHLQLLLITIVVVGKVKNKLDADITRDITMIFTQQRLERLQLSLSEVMKYVSSCIP